MVPDILHDLLEGCVPLNLTEMLAHYVLIDKIFSIDDLNHSLRNFKYGQAEAKDRPSTIEIQHLKNRKLRQSAAQIWLIATNLPLAIGSLIEEKDLRWACYTTLMEICRLIFKSQITELEICHLQSLVFEYLDLFKKCYPNRNITPKMHFLIHYAYLIRLLGPLTAYWCMRYEAKHSYFKQLSHAIGNFINLPFTLSKRHQQFQCKNMQECGSHFLTNHIETPKSKMYPLLSFQCHQLISETLRLLPAPNAELECVSWIKIGSITFKTNHSLVLCPVVGFVTDVKAAFGEIRFIILNG